jgi:glycosyltransferase involved in cell wall biosynthesis
MRVLFLYTELATYFLKCCEALAENAEVHIIRWPVNKEAPFNFDFPENIKVYEKRNYAAKELNQLVTSIDPSVIVCSGWIDKQYLKITRRFFGKIPTVMTCDTKWKGDIRQYIALFLSRIFLLNTFSHAWVPGKAQEDYARRLGFKKANIRLGFYSCDLQKFNEAYIRRDLKRADRLPRRFLYVGRYYEFKGLQDLWQAFIELQNTAPNEWELWCLGTGDLTPVNHPKIKHFGFIQPEDLEPILSQCSVFVLPSRVEPWGVVVQEYAASGFPLLLSSSVGAAEAFLSEGANGYTFESGNIQEIVQSLKKTVKLSDKELISMSEKSHALAQSNSPEKWANTVTDIYYESQKK